MLTFVLSGVLAIAPTMIGPELPPVHDTDEGPAIGFDEALLGAETVPGLTGRAAAIEAKRKDDLDVPRVVNGPQLTVMPGARVTPQQNTGFEVQVTLTQAWNLEKYGAARRKTMDAENGALTAEMRARALDQRLEAARAWVELHAAEQAMKLALEELALATARRDALEEARTEGVATRADVALATADEAEASAVVTELEGVTHDLGLVLAQRTGHDAGVPLRTRGAYPQPELPRPAELTEAFADVDNAPEVVRRRLEARAVRARAADSLARSGTSLITGGAAQREATSDLTLFAVLGLSLPGDRGIRQRNEAYAEARRLEADADQRALELTAVLATAIHELTHSAEREEVLRDRIVPSMAALQDAQAEALAAGEGTRATLLAAQRRHAAARRLLAEAEGLAVWARIEVWLYLEALQ